MLQADALSDLTSKGNKLSVWIIEEDKSNIQEVITALAANSDFISNLDYALIREELLIQLGLKIEHTTGDSADDVVNTQYHRDLVELSAPKLLELAKTLQEKAERNRYSEKHVLGLLVEGIGTGRLDRTRVKLKADQLERIDAKLPTG